MNTQLYDCSFSNRAFRKISGRGNTKGCGGFSIFWDAKDSFNTLL